MSGFSDIIVADGEVTPVNHTYSPMRIENNRAFTKELDVVASVDRETFEFEASDMAKVRKVVTILRVPKVVDETVNGVTVSKEQSFGIVKVETLVPYEWTAQEAKNLRVLSANLQVSDHVADLVDLSEFVW